MYRPHIRLYKVSDNRNAFTLLVMGYTTPKALEFKVWYINKFGVDKD